MSGGGERANILRGVNGAPVPTRAYEQLVATIRTMVLSGELAPGERLAPEAALAERFGVSRPTVREALRVLQESGYLERPSPKILVVRHHSEEPAFREMTHALRRRNVTFRSLHEALLLLEPELTRLAAEHRDDEDLATLDDLLAGQRAAVGDPASWCALDEQFHLALAEASGNAPLILARTPLSAIVIPTTRQFVHSERVATAATDFHERMLDEVRAGDGEAAAFVTRRHVDDFRAAWEHSGLAYDRELGELIDAGDHTFLAPDPPPPDQSIR
jgi:DNA-binding FadR family transcriptional regulator